MKLIVESSLMTPSIAETFSILTSAARICLDDIQNNKTEGIVKLLMKRKELLGFKKHILLGIQPVYGKARLDTVMTIRDVVEMNLKVDDRLVKECDSCFTVLIGLKVDEKELYLGSAEEVSGVTLCEIFIKVKKINIEFADTES